MFKYEIIDERTHKTVFSGYAHDVEEVWQRHFEGGEYNEHYLLVWHQTHQIENNCFGKQIDFKNRIN